MTTINLRDFYPWYAHDEYIEVSEEVAEELHTSRRREAAHAERVRYNKAFYSLDCDDGIEYSACMIRRPRNFWTGWKCSSSFGTPSTPCRSSRAAG